MTTEVTAEVLQETKEASISQVVDEEKASPSLIVEDANPASKFEADEDIDIIEQQAAENPSKI